MSELGLLLRWRFASLYLSSGFISNGLHAWEVLLLQANSPNLDRYCWLKALATAALPWKASYAAQQRMQTTAVSAVQPPVLNGKKILTPLGHGQRATYPPAGYAVIFKLAPFEYKAVEMISKETWTAGFVCHCQFLEFQFELLRLCTLHQGRGPPAPPFGSPIHRLLLPHSVEFILEFLNDWAHNPTESILE